MQLNQCPSFMKRTFKSNSKHARAMQREIENICLTPNKFSLVQSQRVVKNSQLQRINDAFRSQTSHQYNASPVRLYFPTLATPRPLPINSNRI